MGMPGGVWRRGAAGRVGCGAAGRRAGGQAAGLVVPGGVRAASRSRFSHPSAMSRHRSNARASAEAIRDGLYDVEIHKIICSTNAIERLNARYRRAVRVRGHLPNEPGALKCLYLPTPRRCQGPQACSSPGKAAGARTRRYADRRIERSGHHFAGCRSTGRSRATLTTPPCGATFSTATSRCDVLTTRLLEDALARISHPSPLRPGPAAVPAPEPMPKPRAPQATSARASSPALPET
jgi:Transposase, Mutator family